MKGARPYGAMLGESEVVAYILKLRRKPKGGERLSFAAIAECLNREGIATRTGKPWAPETKKLGRIIPKVIVHDFRRTAIRNLARAGVSEAIAMKLCGHETRSVFDRYRIVTGDDLREAAAKLNAATPAVGKVLGKVGSSRGDALS